MSTNPGEQTCSGHLVNFRNQPEGTWQQHIAVLFRLIKLLSFSSRERRCDSFLF